MAEVDEDRGPHGPRIATMEPGKPYYTLPWAMCIDQEGLPWLNPHCPVTTGSAGTSCMRIALWHDGYHVWPACGHTWQPEEWIGSPAQPLIPVAGLHEDARRAGVSADDTGIRPRHARVPVRRPLLYARVWARFMLIAFREHPLWWNGRLNPDGPGGVLAAKLAGVRDVLERCDVDPGLDLDVYHHLLLTWPAAAVDYGAHYLVGHAQGMGLLDSGFIPVRDAATVDEEQRRITEMIDLGGPGAYAAYRRTLGR